MHTYTFTRKNVARFKYHWNKFVPVLLAIAECGFIRRTVRADSPRSVKPGEGIFGSTFPGTLWCGPGNTAKNITELGPLMHVDTCCRDHDKCKDVIPKFSRKNGLFNPTMSPKYNCACDEGFKTCLLRVPRWQNRAAEFIGSLYFETRVFPNCYTKDYPKKCMEKSKTTPWRCATYENTSSKKKIWQWLDFGKWFTGFTAK